MSEFEKVNGTPPSEQPKTSSEDESPTDVRKDDDSPKLAEVFKSPKKTSSVSPKAICKVESPLTPSEHKSPKLVSGASPNAVSKVESSQAHDKDKSEVTDVKSPKVSDVDESLNKATVADESKSPPALVKSKTPDVLSDDKPSEIPSLDKPLKSCEKRKPRLNRRGVYLDSFDLEETKPHKIVKDAESEKSKPKSNIISLASVKKSSTEINIPKEKKKIVLKRKPSTSFDVEEKSESTTETSPQAPPKKKHKPITWP